MSKKLRSVCVAATWLVVLGATAPLLSAAEVAEALGPDVLVFVNIPSVKTLRGGSADSAYARIMAEESVQKFIKEGFPALGNALEAYKNVTGKDISDFADFCEGEAALVVLPDARSGAALAVILEFGERAEEFKQFYAELVAQLPVEWKQVDIPGTTATVGSSPQVDFAYAVAGEHFVFSSSLEALKTVCGGLFSGRAENLAGDAQYLKCLTLGGVEQAELVAYVNVRDILALVEPLMPPEAAHALHEIGLSSLAAALYSSHPLGGGFLDKALMYFPEGRRGVFAAIEPSDEDYHRVFSKVPAEALSASWCRADFAALYAWLSVAVKAAAPEEAVGAFSQRVLEIEGLVGVNLRADLIGSLGKNVVAYEPLPSGILGIGFSGGLGQQVMMVELTDDERFGKALAACWSYLQEHQQEYTLNLRGPPPANTPMTFSFADETFGDTNIYQAGITLGPMVQVAPALAVSDGWLVFAMNAQSVKNALSLSGKKVRSIFDNHYYTKAAAFAGTPNAAASYADVKVIFENTYSLLPLVMPLVLAQLGTDTPIDQFLMPPTQAVSRHLFAIADSVSVSQKTIRASEYGPVGTLRTGYVGGVTGAALAYWFAQHPPEGAPRPEAAQPRESDLKNLGLAMAMYSADWDGAFSNDIETLNRMGYLSPGDRVDPARFTCVPGLGDNDDPRLILAFSKEGGTDGRLVLFGNKMIMNLTDAEVAEQVGGWLDLPENPSEALLETACGRNLRELAASVKRYAEFHDGKVPEKLDKKTDYRFAPLVTRCPAHPSPKGPSYATVAGLDISSVPQDARASVVLVYENGPAHREKPGVVFLDGTLKRLTPDELRQAVESTRKLAPGG
ncbi:MAG: hypothetical protein J7M19_09115 [Planctomycetes bacterium]|nr:hypothetical protein [Planctomycetota bacterium]